LVNKQLETLAYRLSDISTLRNLFSELNFDFADKPVNKDNWNDEQRKIVQEAKIIASKDDYQIYYIQTNTDSLKEWKGVASKIIKDNNGLCMICSHNPGGIKWIFSSLSKEFSKSFSETRHVPIDINPNTGVPHTFVDFLEKIKVEKDSTSTSIASQISDAFDSFAVQIHDELTVNVFEALKVISEGIIGDKNNNLPLTDETLEEIREPIFILLYRIIFILYAEDRGIFPVDNKIYQEEFSLKWIKEEWILESANTKKLAEYDVEKRIKHFFRLIEIGSEELEYDKDEFFMRSYYGRIFDRKINHRLEKWNIPNSNFLEMLSLLTRTKDKKGNYFFLDYSALDTRHLGSIYEHLLEFHLHVKDKKIAELPDPRERKTTGSYYTPKYIVDNVVKNSIEPILKDIIEKNLDKQIQIEKILSLKILDPAMGSGHFLVGAVEYLAQRLCEIEYGTISEQLYIERKRDVVRRCIYGVDINPLSVDLARLSLWLETLSSEKPLSFLSAHLKCGNSLMGTEIDSVFDKQTTLFESEKGRSAFKKNLKKFLMFETLEDDSPSTVKMKLEEYLKMQSRGTIYYDLKFLLDSKISESFGIKVPNLGDYRAKVGENSLDFYTDNTYNDVKKLSDEKRFFHWELEFPHIFYNENGEKIKSGGFDIIIGNPPYVRQETLVSEKKFFESRFQVFTGMSDLYVFFVEKSLALLRKNGVLGLIISNKWLKTNYGEKLRTFVSDYWIQELVDCGDLQIFKNATTYTCIIILRHKKDRNPKMNVCKIDQNGKSIEVMLSKKRFHFDQKKLNKNFWNFADPQEELILEKCKRGNKTIGEYTNGTLFRGIISGFNKAFVIDEKLKNILEKSDPKNKEIIKPYLEGKSIKRYHVQSPNKFIIFTYSGIDIDRYPHIKNHLAKYKKELTPKKNSKEKIGRASGSYSWYEMQVASKETGRKFEMSKIIYGGLSVSPRFTIDYDNYFVNGNIYAIPSEDKKLIGILNSKLGWFLITNTCTKIEGGYAILPSYFEKIPMPKGNSSKIEQSVEKVMTCYKVLHNKGISSEKENKLVKDIDKLNKIIDDEVFLLYSLTSEEKEIIRKKFATLKN